MANLCREAALGPIRSITDIQRIDAEQVSIFYKCNTFLVLNVTCTSPYLLSY